MRIGHDENFLSIEKASPDDAYSAWCFEATALSSSRRFTAFHNRLMLDTSAEVLQEFQRFADYEVAQVRIALSEQGWLQIERDWRGHLSVSYRIVGSRVAAAMEGSVPVEGEFANAFCQEFGALLRPSR